MEETLERSLGQLIAAGCDVDAAICILQKTAPHISEEVPQKECLATLKKWRRQRLFDFETEPLSGRLTAEGLAHFRTTEGSDA